MFCPKLFYPLRMKSHQTSVGKIFLQLICVALSLAFAVSGCTIVQKGRSGESPSSSESNGDSVAANAIPSASELANPDTGFGETSIREDIETLADLRKDIPEQKRRENDALKEVLSLLGEVKAPPEKHREKFNRTMRNMREKRRRQMTKTRDNFNKRERKDRETFLKNLKEAREDFTQKKNDRDERKEFYDEQDEKRREYFANERDARREFESEMRQSDSDFNAFYREKTDEFHKELRIYTQQYQDLQKRLKEKEKSKTGAYVPGSGSKSGAAVQTAGASPTATYEKLATEDK